MIDWLSVGFCSLWILGLSVGLATLGTARHYCYEHKQRLGQVLAKPAFEFALNAGMLLFCLGAAGSAEAIWERALWVVLAMAFGIQSWLAWRRRAKGENGRATR